MLNWVMWWRTVGEMRKLYVRVDEGGRQIEEGDTKTGYVTMRS